MNILLAEDDPVARATLKAVLAAASSCVGRSARWVGKPGLATEST